MQPSDQTDRPVKGAKPAWLAAAEVLDDRWEVIAAHTARGQVLDVGVVDSRRAEAPTAERIGDGSTLLHARLKRHNPNLVGVDIDAEGIALLARAGYDVVCADIETMDLGRQFDCIVAGEIIEHLPNPGLGMTNLRRHLKPDGRLLLTTCNPFCCVQSQKILKYNDIQVHEEHTCWFDPRTLARLLSMCGYEVERLCWLRQPRQHGGWKLWPARWRSYFHPNFLMVARPRGLSAGPT